MADITTACRNTQELHPLAQTACKLFLDQCKRQGIQIFITETYRSQERQNWLYEQGRSRSGQIVTWTKSSRHTKRMAWDIACKKPQNLYAPDVLKCAGDIAKRLGITWGGTWDTPDYPHFEITRDWKAPKEEKEMTVDEAKKLIQYKCGFDETTMLYLQLYRYADSMILRLAEQMQY